MSIQAAKPRTTAVRQGTATELYITAFVDRSAGISHELQERRGGGAGERGPCVCRVLITDTDRFVELGPSLKRLSVGYRSSC